MQVELCSEYPNFFGNGYLRFHNICTSLQLSFAVETVKNTGKWLLNQRLQTFLLMVAKLHNCRELGLKSLRPFLAWLRCMIQWLLTQ